MNRAFNMNSDVCYKFRQMSQFFRSQVRLVYHDMESIFTFDQKYGINYVMTENP